MGSFDRYIFRTTFGAFLLICISLTAVIWLTHALREIDLMTNQRQTVLVFVGITGMLIPMLVLVIAPIALVIAVGHTLNRLNTDSEIVVMNASGMSPWRIFRPFLTTTIVVSVLVLGISAYLAPKGLRELRIWATKVKADFVINIVQPGRFITIERGLTFHIRERRNDGQLLGIFIDDRRDDKERVTSLAEYGEIVESGTGTFLLLMNGAVHRLEAGTDRSDHREVRALCVRSLALRRRGAIAGLRRARAQSVGRRFPGARRSHLQAIADAFPRRVA